VYYDFFFFLFFLPCSTFPLVSLQRFSLTLSVRQQVTVYHVIPVFPPCVCHCCSQLNYLVIQIGFICIWKNIISFYFFEIWMNNDQDLSSLQANVDCLTIGANGLYDLLSVTQPSLIWVFHYFDKIFISQLVLKTLDLRIVLIVYTMILHFFIQCYFLWLQY